METLLSVKNLCAAYVQGGQRVRVVDGVSLELRRGEVLGIAGESGCGKSTLAQVLALLARPPLWVEQGEFWLDGTIYHLAQEHRLSRELRGCKVAMLPQGALNALNPTARIREIALEVIRAHQPKTTPQEAYARTQERLERLGLPVRVLKAYPHQLSGGMRQRVVTVISTLLNPKVLIADEPTSALDVSSQKAVVKLLRELLEQRVIEGVIFIAHDLPLLRNVADRIAIMYAGKVVELGPSREMVEASRHPYTKALVEAVLVPEPYIRQRRVEGIEGTPPDLRAPPPGCRFAPRCRYAWARCRELEPPPFGDKERFAACWLLEGMSA
ncbi:MAG: ABC transporter ATP-binding protein [Meiothermus sp.]|uniref:ABC transporter ATP-binding protein n=1 Tax=Meiothermus sp. TaxID=1955249 RepID=UPI00298F1053|nr:ABC transporter ATP-binding protein [Meiothermus sp.]MDW8482233.1 ABC transporter ATP-binding protein [Meiothermus sp.]